MKLVLKTDDEQEIELKRKNFDTSKDKVTVIQIALNRYTKEILQKVKLELEKYFPNVIILDKSIKIKQFKIEK